MTAFWQSTTCPLNVSTFSGAQALIQSVAFLNYKIRGLHSTCIVVQSQLKPYL